jgi:hypothetical protein
MPVSTREERRQQRKLARQEAQRQRARGDALRRYGLVGGLVVVLIAAAVVIVMFAQKGGGASSQPSVPGEVHFSDPVTARNQLYEHVPDSQPITADPNGHYPPTFGNHYSTWRPPGIYDSPVPEGNFVHDLEHGAIVILYNCPSACPELTDQLRGLLTSLPRSNGQVKLVISPNSKIDHRLAVLAWDWELDLDGFDGAAIRAFYQEHVDKGNPEKGATI